MPNILINPESGFLEFNTGSASGSAFDTSLSGAARLKFQNSGELNLTSLGTGVADKFTVDGSNGRLLTVNNTVTGSIFSVNDVAGLPIVEVFSDDRVVMGQYASDALVVSGSGVSFAHIPTVSGNPFITGFTEGDTLQTVTDRGSTTTNSITINSNNLLLSDSHYIRWGNTNYRIQGSNGGGYLKLYAAGSEAITIDSSRNVGIGTTSPSNQYYNNLVVGNNSAGEKGITIRSNASNGGHLAFSDTDSANAGRYAGRISYFHDTNKMQFYTTAGDHAMTINNAQNVGIGTTNPNRKVVIDAGAGYPLKLNATQDYLLGLARNDTEQWWLKVNTAGDFTIHEDSADDRFRIKAGGNVGIGVGDPDVELEVDGNIKVSAGRFYQMAGTDYRIGTDGTPSRIQFHAGGSERMTISGNGKVGIGVTNPAAKLEITGDTTTYDGMAKIYLTDGSSNSASRNWSIGNGGSAYGNLTFAVSAAKGGVAGDATSTNAMVIANDGRVGIGVIDPDTLLEVAGVIKSSSTSRVQADVYNNSANSANIIYRSSTNTIVGNNASALVIQDGGNVGIGTNNPSQTLHVGGTARVSGHTDLASSVDISSKTRIYNKLGIGAGSSWVDPANGIDVYGSVAIGTSYIEVTAPSNGAIIQGNVGIGTNSPDSNLSIVNTAGIVGMNLKAAADNICYIDFGDSSDNNIGGINYSNTDDTLNFRAGNTNRVTITSAGNVGIGTASPSETLHVLGTTRLGGRGYTGGASIEYASLSETNGGASTILGNAVYAGNANNTYRKTRSDAGNYIQLNYNKGITFHTNVTGSASSTEYDINNHEQVRITTAGNVGIGTATPDKQLHISHATQPYLRLEESDSGGNKRLDLFVSSSTGVIGANQSAQTMMFQTVNATRMTIASDGDVGIGTTNPTSKLHVKGPINITRTVNTDTSSIDMEGNFRFTAQNGYRTTFFNNGLERVRFDVNGNVGIGTNSPGEALDVVGFIRMGNATANSTQKIARQVVRAYNTSHNDFMAFMGTANETSNVVSYGGGSSDQTCATKLAFYTHTNVSTSTAGTQRMHINSIGKIGIGAATSFSTDHAGMKLQICAEDTSPSLNTTAIDDCSLVISNEDEDYGTVFAVKSNGIGQIQQRRMSAATYYSLELQPFGGNVGVGTESPSDKLQVNGSFSASSKTFNIEHPTQSGKRLIHGCFEGPEHGVYFRGKTQDSGIQAPEYWSGLVDIDSMTVDVTPIGPNQSIYVDRIEDNGDVYVGANTDEPLNYFYIIYGERKDVDKLEVVKDNPPPNTGIA